MLTTSLFTIIYLLFPISSARRLFPTLIFSLALATCMSLELTSCLFTIIYLLFPISSARRLFPTLLIFSLILTPRLPNGNPTVIDPNFPTPVHTMSKAIAPTQPDADWQVSRPSRTRNPPKAYSPTQLPAEYSLKIDKAAKKKIEASDRTVDCKIEYKTNNLVMEFSSAAYELFKESVEVYFANKSVTVKQKPDVNGLIVHETLTIKAATTLEKEIVINLYNTSSRVTVNGPLLGIFVTNHLSSILEKLKQCTSILEINRQIRAVCHQILGDNKNPAPSPKPKAGIKAIGNNNSAVPPKTRAGIKSVDSLPRIKNMTPATRSRMAITQPHTKLSLHTLSRDDLEMRDDCRSPQLHTAALKNNVVPLTAKRKGSSYLPLHEASVDAIGDDTQAQQHLCTSCDKPIEDDALWCTSCNHSYHASCCGIPTNDHAANSENYTCPSCIIMDDHHNRSGGNGTIHKTDSGEEPDVLDATLPSSATSHDDCTMSNMTRDCIADAQLNKGTAITGVTTDVQGRNCGTVITGVISCDDKADRNNNQLPPECTKIKKLMPSASTRRAATSKGPVRNQKCIGTDTVALHLSPPSHEVDISRQYEINRKEKELKNLEKALNKQAYDQEHVTRQLSTAKALVISLENKIIDLKKENDSLRTHLLASNTTPPRNDCVNHTDSTASFANGSSDLLHDISNKVRSIETQVAQLQKQQNRPNLGNGNDPLPDMQHRVRMLETENQCLQMRIRYMEGILPTYRATLSNGNEPLLDMQHRVQMLETEKHYLQRCSRSTEQHHYGNVDKELCRHAHPCDAVNTARTRTCTCRHQYQDDDIRESKHKCSHEVQENCATDDEHGQYSNMRNENSNYRQAKYQNHGNDTLAPQLGNYHRSTSITSRRPRPVPLMSIQLDEVKQRYQLVARNKGYNKTKQEAERNSACHGYITNIQNHHSDSADKGRKQDELDQRSYQGDSEADGYEHRNRGRRYHDNQRNDNQWCEESDQGHALRNVGGQIGNHKAHKAGSENDYDRNLGSQVQRQQMSVTQTTGRSGLKTTRQEFHNPERAHNYWHEAPDQQRQHASYISTSGKNDTYERDNNARPSVGSDEQSRNYPDNSTRAMENPNWRSRLIYRMGGHSTEQHGLPVEGTNQSNHGSSISSNSMKTHNVGPSSDCDFQTMRVATKQPEEELHMQHTDSAGLATMMFEHHNPQREHYHNQSQHMRQVNPKHMHGQHQDLSAQSVGLHLQKATNEDVAPTLLLMDQQPTSEREPCNTAPNGPLNNGSIVVARKSNGERELTSAYLHVGQQQNAQHEQECSQPQQGRYVTETPASPHNDQEMPQELENCTAGPSGLINQRDSPVAIGSNSDWQYEQRRHLADQYNSPDDTTSATPCINVQNVVDPPHRLGDDWNRSPAPTSTQTKHFLGWGQNPRLLP